MCLWEYEFLSLGVFLEETARISLNNVAGELSFVDTPSVFHYNSTFEGKVSLEHQSNTDTSKDCSFHTSHIFMDFVVQKVISISIRVFFISVLNWCWILMLSLSFPKDLRLKTSIQCLWKCTSKYLCFVSFFR